MLISRCVAALVLGISPYGRRQLLARTGAMVSAASAASLTPPLGVASVGTGMGSLPVFESRRPCTVVLPLADCGGSFCTVFNVEGSLFRAVVDTGSPFVSVAGSCTKRWGCYQGQGHPSGLADTYESYDGREGPVSWRRGTLTLGDGPSSFSDAVTFGVLSDSLVGRPGGVFLGLVKRERLGVRPTFLSQTPFSSFRVDLRRVEAPKLVLSTAPLVPVDAHGVSMVDLRQLGSPVEHYAAKVGRISVDGRNLDAGDSKPIYAIFDTGTTGLAMSSALWDASVRNYMEGIAAPWTGRVGLDIPTKRGPTMSISADRPFPVTPIQSVPWRGFDGHLVVVGLTFLAGRALTVDCNRRILWLGYEGEERIG